MAVFEDDDRAWDALGYVLFVICFPITIPVAVVYVILGKLRSKRND